MGRIPKIAIELCKLHIEARDDICHVEGNGKVAKCGRNESFEQKDTTHDESSAVDQCENETGCNRC